MNNLFYGKVNSDLKVIFDNREFWLNRLEYLKDQDVQVTIDKRRKPRSSKQNNYLWGAVYRTISLETGHTTQELHEIFGQMFLKSEKVFNGKLITVIKSTSELSKGEMVEYIMNIQIEVGTMGIDLPDPDTWDPVKLI